MNVVPVKVGNENVGEQRAAIRFMQQLVPQRAQACATIENIKRVAQTYLDTRGVAAIPQVLGLRSGRRSAHTPELDAHSPPQNWPISLYLPPPRWVRQFICWFHCHDTSF